MIVRTLDEVVGTDRDVSGETWTSRRLLLAHEGMGFSMHDTLIHAGTTTEMHYKHHLEAVYCVEGEGTLEDLETGQTHRIVPGTIYALDGHERHVLRATKTLRLVCVFNPPVTGREVHGEDGAYPPPPDAAATAATAAPTR
ncbi:MAG: ectoine synthase [Myxococcales bacterium]|nr:ectoine synthase [Myxococcales bacterium]